MSRDSIETNTQRVLVTRPEHQSAEFINLLEQNGYQAMSFPTIQIQAVALEKNLQSKLGSLASYDIVIFISANAVEYALSAIKALNIPVQIKTIAVVGKATQQAVTDAGLVVDISPVAGFNTEALLALEPFQAKHIKSKRVLIVRGVGGRETLAENLILRGADVDYAEVYQRSLPQTDTKLSRIELSRKWTQFLIQVITVTSNESLQNLYDMLESPGKDEMLNTRLIVPSQRSYKLAQDLGFSCITVADSALNQHMLEAVINE